MEIETHTITVCMGSSCFSRGNNINAEIIQKFIEMHNIGDQITVKGCLCVGECKKGPNIKIDDILFTGVSPEGLSDLLEHKLLKE